MYTGIVELSLFLMPPLDNWADFLTAVIEDDRVKIIEDTYLYINF